MHKHFVNQIVYVRSLSCNTDYTCININVNALDQVALCIRARGSRIRRMKVSKIQLKKQKQKKYKKYKKLNVQKSLLQFKISAGR